MLAVAAYALLSCLARSEHVVQAPPAPITYALVPLPKDREELGRLYTAEQLALLEKLNRRDLSHLPRAVPKVPGLVVPDRWDAGELAYSPMPAAYAWAEPYAKAIVVHQPQQVFGAYEHGRLVRWGPVSSGRRDSRTPEGSYNLTWRSKGHHSTVSAEWFLPWYFNFINERGVSFHQFDLPGYPASHACVRLLERDAKWLYEWGESWVLSADRRSVVTPGTAVRIVGTYAYPAEPPWTDVRAVGPIPLPDTDR